MRTISFKCMFICVLISLSGCFSMPDNREMHVLRANKAVKRLQELDAKQTVEGSVHLTGNLLLQDAINKALEQNLRLRQAREEREIVRGHLQQSLAEILPGLALTGSYLRYDDELGAIREGAYSITRHQDQYRLGLRLTQPLFDGKMLPALRTSRLYRQKVEESIRQLEENIRYEVTTAYYNAVLSERILEVKFSSLKTAERQLTDTEVRRKQGMASNYDALRAEVEVSNFRAQVLQARNEKDVAYTALFRLIGASPASAVKLVDSIPLFIENISFSDALQTALTHRADLAEAEFMLKMQRENLSAIEGRYLPVLSAYAAQNWSNPHPRDSAKDSWGDERQAGLDLSLSIFDGLDRRGTLIQERARLRQAEIALRDAEEEVVSEIRQLLLSLKTAEEFANSQSRNLETAKEAVRLVETGMKEGQNTPVEVMDARQALTTASANYYQSLFDHATARVALLRAMGLLSDACMPERAILTR